MLSACWQCIGGNQDINTADSVALNLPVITDKNMFLLPKALSGGDSFTVQGLIQDDPKMVTISLIGGIQAPDYGNIICKVDVEFSNGEENMTISQVTNGISEIVQQYSGTEVLNGSDVKIQFRARKDDMLHLYSSFSSFIGEIPLNLNINNAKYMSFGGDLKKITELKFEFV